jgi:NAD(P)-dependent dehydrogenase (short-subunit alcohol dehydrogenase family)
MLLQDHIAVVTGGASERGIGRATAELMLAHGAAVAIVDSNEEALAATCAALGERARGYVGNVTDWDQTRDCFARIVADLGVPHTLVNNAGITQPKGLLEIADADFDAVIGVSLKGGFHCAKAVVPYMARQRRGSIINMSSVSAERGGGIFGGPHYSAAKAGLLGLMRALARDHAREGIRVNAIAPGFIETGITGDNLSAEQRQMIAESIPMGRMGAPLDVARVCVFLASELSEYVTGEVIDVNGGMHIY